MEQKHECYKQTDWQTDQWRTFLESPLTLWWVIQKVSWELVKVISFSDLYTFTKQTMKLYCFLFIKQMQKTFVYILPPSFPPYLPPSLPSPRSTLWVHSTMFNIFTRITVSSWVALSGLVEVGPQNGVVQGVQVCRQWVITLLVEPCLVTQTSCTCITVRIYQLIFPIA